MGFDTVDRLRDCVLLRDKSVDHSFDVGVTTRSLEVIADAIATRVRGARKIDRLELSAHTEISMESFRCTRAPNDPTMSIALLIPLAELKPAPGALMAEPS
jgi:hypothetical protein